MSRDTEISAEMVIVQRVLALRIIKVVVGESNIENLVALGVQIRHRHGTTFLGKEANFIALCGFILSEKMVVLVLIYDEGNLGCSSRAFELKRAGENTFRIISH